MVLALSAVLLNLLFLPLALSRLRLSFVSAALFSRLPHSPQAEKEEPQADYGGAAYESKGLPAGTGTRIAANRGLVYLLIVNDSVNGGESEPEGSCQQHRRHDDVTSIRLPHQGKAAYDGSDNERRRPEGKGLDVGKSGARRHESGNADYDGDNGQGQARTACPLGRGSGFRDLNSLAALLSGEDEKLRRRIPNETTRRKVTRAGRRPHIIHYDIHRKTAQRPTCI